MTKPPVKQPDLTPLDLELWSGLIEKRCGLNFEQSRVHSLKRGLSERLEATGFSSYGDYYRYVAFNPKGEAEWKYLLEILVNHETCFFRHAPSFEALHTHIFPTLLREKTARNESAFRLWSAACSTGEEAYSLAMAALEKIPPTVFRLEVVGSDISESVLERARTGRYKSFSLRSEFPAYRERYLRQVSKIPQPVFEVTEPVRKLVTFSFFNLIDQDTYPKLLQDVIFCQNALIYFKTEVRLDIVKNLCARLSPGGFLVLGPGEVIGLKLPEVRTVRLENTLVYQRSYPEVVQFPEIHFPGNT
ncbi:MAG: protein-glutamate O-methyltransferase CheR [Blastocatellia bacterium]|nr:protein-glutamate O-methyltransferase CheR [Blastocatellia bacterium]